MSGRTARARREFAKVVQIEPASDYAHFALALACERTGQRTRAIGHLKLAIAMRPGTGTTSAPRTPRGLMLADRYGCILFDLDGVLYRGRTRFPGAPHHGRAPATRRPPRLPDQQLLPDATPGGRQAAGDRDRGGPGRGRDLRARDRRAARGAGGGRVRDRPGRRSRGVDRRRHPDPRGRAEEADLVVVGFDAAPRTGRSSARRCWSSAGRVWSRRTRTARTPPPTGCGREPARSCPSSRRRRAPSPRSSASRSTRCSRPVAGGGGGRPLVVGDRLDTDIEGAARLGWDTMLVLTGVSGPEDVERTGIRPTVIAEDVSALLEDP